MISEGGDHASWVLMQKAAVTDAEGNYPAAKSLLEESQIILYEQDFRIAIANSRHKQVRVAQHEGDWDMAAACFAESLAIWREPGSWRQIVEALEGVAEVAEARRQPHRAARLFGAAAALRESGGWPLLPVYRADLEQSVAATRAALDEEAFAAAWAEGRAMQPEQAIDYALEEVG
jgi:hypothetical protein